MAKIVKAKLFAILPALLGTLIFLFVLIAFFLIWIPDRILSSPEYIYRFEIGVIRYLGLLPIVLGIVIYIYCAVMFGIFNIHVFMEERLLSEQFGADYKQYRQSVPRWIPRLRPYKKNASESRQSYNK